MLKIEKVRKLGVAILTIGSYPTIIQSILDFDYLSGANKPSIKGIIASGRRFERYFFGKREILIPVYSSVEAIPEEKVRTLTYFLNLSSGRRVLASSVEIINKLPALIGGVIFAENVPEKHSIELREFARDKGVFVIGPASVGLVIPGKIKLGAIGGVDHKQIINAKLFDSGSVAVLSASGGMTNEIINVVTAAGKRISFSLSFGGDRFPILKPRDAFEAAEEDSETKTVVYFGELGGIDEYDVIELIQTGKFTKKVVAYIAGTVAEIFPSSPQFGHAKAMAATEKEAARAKRDALKAAGVAVGESFSEFVEFMKALPENASTPEVKAALAPAGVENNVIIESMEDRKHALISSSISKDEDGEVKILGESLLTLTNDHTFGYIVASMFL